MSSKEDFSLFKNLLPKNVLCLNSDIVKSGGRCIIVGGWVRDRLLDIPITPKVGDIDIEVFGLTYNHLYSICLNYGIKARYQNFGVIKLNHMDISLPRTEVVVGKKYNDFKVNLNPYLTFKQAAFRRDFSVNAIGWDLLMNVVLDPFGGINAVKEKVLIPLSEHFKEDNYRVLRAIQLIARFNFRASNLLIKFARTMDPRVVSQKHLNKTKTILQTSQHKKSVMFFLEKIGKHWKNLFA